MIEPQQKIEEGYYVVQLYRNGAPFAKRSLTCGRKTFEDAVAQWNRSGYKVIVEQQPKSHVK